MNLLAGLLALLFAGSFAPGTAVAQTADDYHPFLSDRFNIGIGIFYPNKSFKIRVDGSAPEEESISTKP